MVDYNKKTNTEPVTLSLSDSDNFYYLMNRYESKLIRYILRIAHIDKASSEDILQEVFIKTYKNLNDFD